MTRLMKYLSSFSSGALKTTMSLRFGSVTR